MAESNEPFVQRGATILMYFPEGVEVAGMVRWRDGARFGVRFYAELPQELVAGLLDRGIAVDGYDIMTDCFGRQLPPLRQPIKVPIKAPE